MIIITHVLAGAATAVAVSQVTADPVIPLLAGVVSHYVFDTIPHFDVPPSAMTEDEGPLKLTAELKIQIAVDLFLTALVVGFLWLARFDFPELSPFALGAFGGVLPDLVDNVPFWNGVIHRLPGFRELYAFHRSTHRLWKRRFPMPEHARLGILTQLVVTVLSLSYLLTA